jgi:cytochrome b561
MQKNFAGDELRIRSVRRPFDALTRSLHWATVLMVLAMFASAWLHAWSRDEALKVILLQTHRSLGVTIWVTTVLRLAWRLSNAKLPPFPIKMTKIHRAFVQASEYCLYGLLLSQPATGLGDTLFRGRGFALFIWRIPQLMPADPAWRASFYFAHQLGACLLGVLVAGHAAAALVHHFILRDDVLHCMAPTITERPKPEVPVGGIIQNQHS